MIRIDCDHYRGAMPCGPHKRDGRLCDSCEEYKPIVDRLLLIKLGAVGDVLRTTCLLPALHDAYVQPEITWLTRQSAAPLLAGNPYVSRVLTLEEPYLEFLLRERFTAGICLDAEPHPAGLLALSHCGTRLGFQTDERGRVVPANPEATEWWLMGVDDGRKRSNRRTFQALMHEVCTLAPRVSRPILTIPDEARHAADHLLRGFGLPDGRSIVGLNTGGGARWQHKKWTTSGWMGLIEELSNGPNPPALLLLGGPEETTLNARLANQFGGRIVPAGCQHELMTFAALIGAVDVLVTPDSLALHIATALARPVVAVVGPTSPWELELYGLGEVLTGDIDCICCYRTSCDKQPACMDLVAADQVASAVRRWTGAASRRTDPPAAHNGFPPVWIDVRSVRAAGALPSALQDR